VGVTDPNRPDWRRLTGFEVATRLSYTLWGAGPDEALLQAAAAGQLDTADGVEAAARRMLGDAARSRPALAHLGAQWLGIDKLGEIMRSRSAFPTFTPDLARSMAAELARLAEDFMKPGASFLDLYDARHGYADGRLAVVYGVPAPSGGGLQRIEFGASADRGGFFATAGALAGPVRGDEADPIARGKFVREHMLCQELPTPPSDAVAAGMMVEPMAGESKIDAQERLIASLGACATCHVMINPIGHGLDRYDAVGKLRAVYPNGRPVRREGHVEGLAEPRFAGGVELGRLIKGSAEGQGCVVRQAFRWAFGRHEDQHGARDACTLAEIEARWKAGRHGYPELLLGLVRAEAFRYRRAER
jgi:hypothetical protein